MKSDEYGCYLMENVEDVVWKLCVEKLIVVMLIFFFKKSGQKMWVRWWELSIRCSWKIFFSKEVENVGVHRDDVNECRNFVSSLLYIQQSERKNERESDVTNENACPLLLSLSLSLPLFINQLYRIIISCFFLVWCKLKSMRLHNPVWKGEPRGNQLSNIVVLQFVMKWSYSIDLFEWIMRDYLLSNHCSFAWRWMYLFELTHLHLSSARAHALLFFFKFVWYLMTLTLLPLRVFSSSLRHKSWSRIQINDSNRIWHPACPEDRWKKMSRLWKVRWSNSSQAMSDRKICRRSSNWKNDVRIMIVVLLYENSDNNRKNVW